MARERERGVIAGHEHHAVEQLLDRIRLSGAQIHRRALDRRVFRQDLDRFLERTVLEHDERRQDLCRAGDAEACVCILFIEHRSGLGMHDDGGLCRIVRTGSVGARCARKEHGKRAQERKYRPFQNKHHPFEVSGGAYCVRSGRGLCFVGLALVDEPVDAVNDLAASCR